MSSVSELHRRPGIGLSQAREESPEIGEPMTSSMDPALRLYTEVVLTIFRYLDLHSLGRASGVSRQWCALTRDWNLWSRVDLKALCPGLEVFDGVDLTTHIDLAAYGLSVDDAPVLDKPRMISILKRCLSLPVEEDAGVTLLLIPKGLTLKKLIQLARSPKQGNSTPLGYIWDRILTEMGDAEVTETYWIVITNTIFKNSRKLSVVQHKDLVAHHGCEMPRTLEQAFLLVVTYMRDGKRLCKNDPLTYSRCAERVSECPVIVGGFSWEGFCVSLSGSFGYDYHGVGGVLRKLETTSIIETVKDENFVTI